MVGVGNRDPVRKKTLRRCTPSSSLMPNKSPHQSQTTTQGEANIYVGNDLGPCCRIKAPQKSLPSVPAFSVLHGQEKATWKSRPGHLLFYHCVLILYECIYDMKQ